MGVSVFQDGQVHGWEGEIRPKQPRSGNRCGHDPAKPRLELKNPAGTNLPPSIQMAIDSVDNFYHYPDRTLPSIRVARNQQTDNIRQYRSEGRECLVLVIKMILKYTNLLTLRCEIPTANGLMALDMEWMAEEAGVGYRRLERAFKWLKAAGLIEVKGRKTFKNGAYRSIAAVKCVSTLLFKFLGVLDQYRTDVDYKIDQKKAASKKEKKAQSAEQAVFEANLVKQFSQGKKTLKASSAKQKEDQESASLAHARRQYQLTLLRLQKENPDMSVEDIQKAAGEEERKKWFKLLR